MSLMTFGWLSTVQAANITVDTLQDESDGSCGDGDCSLLDAIDMANPGDTIDFNVTGTIPLSLGELNLNKIMSILGPGHDTLTISGENISRIFYLYDGVEVTVSDVTIAAGSADDGAGIYNAGTLIMTRLTISDNIAYYDGGGIYNYDTGVLYVEQSSFIGNQASWGGGIKNEDATATVTNSTFYDNFVSARGAGMDNGGIDTGSDVIIRNSTFNANSGYGAIGNPNSVTLVTNTIIGGNEIDCSGDFAEGSKNNLSTDDSSSPIVK